MVGTLYFQLVPYDKVGVFCKFHEIWVKTLGDIAPRSVMERQTNGQIRLDLVNDDTCPSGHISRPTDRQIQQTDSI